MTSIDMLSPPLSVLDSNLYEFGCDESSAHSFQSRSGTTTDDSGRAELQCYLNSPRSSPSLTSHSTSTVSSSSSYLSPLSSGYLSTPAPAFSPFPKLSPAILNGEWGDRDVRIRESPEPYECSQPESALSNSPSGAMRYVLRHIPRLAGPLLPVPHLLATDPNHSTAALPLGSSFSMSGDRGSFHWPVMMTSGDSDTSLLGNGLSMGAGSDEGFAPGSGSRSPGGSPPRQPLSAEQREIKRQMDQARRESKSAARFRRSNSNPYLADAPSSALGVPTYTSSAPSISLLAEPATTGGSGPSYLSPYSQPLQEPDSAGLSSVPMYGASMQQQSM